MDTPDQLNLIQGAPAASCRWQQREVARFESDDVNADSTTLVIIGGVHGNEPAGLLAAQRVISDLEMEQPTGFKGRLVVLAGNLKALNHTDPDTRYIDHDLNRLFTDQRIAEPIETSAEHEQMHELLAAIRSLRAQCARMIVVDLHTTSSDTQPVIVLEDAIPTRRFARAFPLPIYLGFEEELDGLLIDRIASEMGSVSIVIEGGQHKDPKAIDVHEAAIWMAMDVSGLLRMNAMAHDPTPSFVLQQAVGDQSRKVFDIRHLCPIKHPSFTICDGIVAGKKIKQGVTAIAMEAGRTITSPTRGRVFLPNMQARKRVGDDGFFIVRHVGEGWLGFSARIRRQAWVHRIIAHMPGVYRRDEQLGGGFYVDGDIAAVLKRQVFHLLGYRLIRHDHRDVGHGIRRAFQGISAFCRAFFRGPIPGGPDPDDTRFWVVQRHTLDR